MSGKNGGKFTRMPVGIPQTGEGKKVILFCSTDPFSCFVQGLASVMSPTSRRSDSKYV